MKNHNRGSALIFVSGRLAAVNLTVVRGDLCQESENYSVLGQIGLIAGFFMAHVLRMGFTLLKR